MDTKKRTQRSSAGLNESLSQDFVWPKKFGEKKVPLQEQAAKSVDDNCFSKPMNGKSLNENKYSENRLVTSVTHDRQEEKKEMRLVGSVKRVIGKILYQQNLREETLLTFLAEAEYIVNSRPLTRVSSDPDDLESITPNHFLFGSSDGLGPPLPQMMDGRIIRKEWEKSRALTESFWNRWVKEYLPTLTKRSKWTNDQKPIEIGDIVLIVDDSMPRFNWKLGKVIRTHHGIDNRIRVVDVKTATQEYRRPVHKICRLEIQ
ncbi:uncharacterized protein LOC123313148 [Coccinella septempunctata]|uniref:uncharacterized protein LOC123313148 n=1 Tax=Coccinella septempunctata TaxID=41139 RepID=UPI001D094385|nr:uncharacterized protein LOC123313148 [Coccinella septempunctata]